MSYFDYLYYLMYKVYSAYKENRPESTAAGILGGFQTLNVISLIMAIACLRGEKTGINVPVFIGLFIVFQVYTYVKYIYKEKPSVQSIEKKWMSKTGPAKTKIRVLLFLYCAVTVISVFGMAIYLGSKKE